jgi:hypothetical protein
MAEYKLNLAEYMFFWRPVVKKENAVHDPMGLAGDELAK